MTTDGKEEPTRSDMADLGKGKRSLRFVIRMSNAEREGFEEAAHQVGLTLSSFMRHLLVRAVNRLRKKRNDAENDPGPTSPGVVK